MDADGDFTVVWEGADDDKKGVYMQRFTATGFTFGGETLANTSTAGDQKKPAIGMDADGHLLIVWETKGSDEDVAGQLYQSTDGVLFTVGDGDDDASMVFTGSQSIINQALDGLVFTPTLNFNSSPDATIEIVTDDQGFSGTGGVLTDTDTINITVNGLNNAAVITNLAGDGLAYDGGTGALIIEQGGDAVVIDVDSPDFNTGNLTVSIALGADDAEDELSVNNEGVGGGQIGFASGSVTYGGTEIGTAVGGSSGADLVVTFDTDATPTAVTALVKNITYENTDGASPTLGARTVRFTIDDGDGDISAAADAIVTVFDVNAAPAITNLTGDALAFDEGSAAQIIEEGGDAAVTDADSTDFDLGNLTVSIAAGGDLTDDVLSINNQGGGAGQIGFAAGSVTYGGTEIGTAVGGSSGVDLVVTFDTDATPTAVTALVKNITYQNTDSTNPTTDDRTVIFTVNDGDGATSSTSAATVSINLINDAPVLDNNGSMTLTDVVEDDSDPAGDSVAAMIASDGGDRITDMDPATGSGSSTRAPAGRPLGRWTTPVPCCYTLTLPSALCPLPITPARRAISNFAPGTAPPAIPTVSRVSMSPPTAAPPLLVRPAKQLP